MPVDLNQLSPADRADFQRRLATFGIDPSAVQESLTVPVSGRTTLAFGPQAASAREPTVVRTKDIAAVKRMVGVDSRVFRNVSPRVKLPAPISLGRFGVTRAGRLRDSSGPDFQAGPGLGQSDDAIQQLDDEALAALDDDAINNVREAARAFVRGDSELVTSFQPLINRVLGTITIPVWPVFNVYVSSGSTLEFGTGVNALVAHEVIIEEGGRIRCRGHLTIDAVRVRRPRFVVGPSVLTARTFRPIFSDD